MSSAPAASIAARGYARPEVLVTTDWVAEHLKDPEVRIVESNEDPLLYPSGHIPGAVQVDWAADLNDPLRRDYLDRAGFERLMAKIGVTRDTTVVFYGDKNNWWACYAFWVFQLFGHTNAKVMDGGRLKWEKEGRALTREVPSVRRHALRGARARRHAIRAFRDEVLQHMRGAASRWSTCAARRSSRGERTHMPEYPQEGVLRGGHIPGARTCRGRARPTPRTARSRPPTSCARSTRTRRASSPTTTSSPTAASASAAATPGSCSPTCWATRKVRNYDGSWTEWGNSVGCRSRSLTAVEAMRSTSDMAVSDRRCPRRSRRGRGLRVARPQRCAPRC